MSAVTDKDLEQKQEKNQKLREKIADAEALAATRVQDESRVMQAELLDAETARLEAQLSAAKEAAKVTTVREGASALNDQIAEQKAAAEGGVTPPGVAVDTNADKSADEKNGGNS